MNFITIIKTFGFSQSEDDLEKSQQKKIVGHLDFVGVDLQKILKKKHMLPDF